MKHYYDNCFDAERSRRDLTPRAEQRLRFRTLVHTSCARPAPKAIAVEGEERRGTAAQKHQVSKLQELGNHLQS